VYTPTGSTPFDQYPYIIFSFTNNGTPSAPILNSAVGPSGNYTSFIQQKDSQTEVVIVPAVQNLYQNSTAPSALVIYVTPPSDT
jgi:hypothetical protein